VILCKYRIDIGASLVHFDVTVMSDSILTSAGVCWWLKKGWGLVDVFSTGWQQEGHLATKTVHKLAHRWVYHWVCDTWHVQHQTYSYLPSHRAWSHAWIGGKSNPQISWWLQDRHQNHYTTTVTKLVFHSTPSPVWEEHGGMVLKRMYGEGDSSRTS